MILVVSGATGFVGSAILRRAAAHGLRGIAVARQKPQTAFTDWVWRTRDEMMRNGGDRIDCAVHLEVKQHVTRPKESDIQDFESVNVRGTQQWLEWCSRNAVFRFVQFSSVKAVYAAREGRTSEDSGRPHSSWYGRSKWTAERGVEEWVSEDPRRSALILRPAVIYGPGNVGNVGAMVSATARSRFFLVGRNDNVKSLVSINNVVAAVAFLLPRMTPGTCEIYNLVDRESYTVRQIDAMIRAQFGKRGNSPSLPLGVARLAARVGDAVHRLTGRSFPINSNRLDALLEHTHFSCDKLLATGFVHPQTTAEGLREMVDWYRGQEARTIE